MEKLLFTSESVTEGHPDIVADRIADHILDVCLAQDPQSRVACEVQVSKNLVVLAGEITTKAQFDYDEEVRSVIRNIGYTNPNDGFSDQTVTIINNIHKQSPDIALGVDNATDKEQKDIGAGDIGIMFGYATKKDGTFNLMPLPMNLANLLVREMDRVRKAGIIAGMKPDGKAQVTVEYDHFTGKPVHIDTVVLCASHAHMNKEQYATFKHDLQWKVIAQVLPDGLYDSNTKVYINPTGWFEVHGPYGDCGTTGRKIVVAQYGGACAVGGGSLSTKDPTKVDRTGAYAARHVAKSLVANGLCNECEVQIGYAIGRADPVSIRVKTFENNPEKDAILSEIVRDNFDLRPAAIIKEFDLRRPIYENLANYGHYGRDVSEAPWERVKTLDVKVPW